MGSSDGMNHDLLTVNLCQLITIFLDRCDHILDQLEEPGVFYNFQAVRHTTANKEPATGRQIGLLGDGHAGQKFSHY